MRIHRIRLRNFRGVVDREVRLATTGVTIVRGDNETGKSSLREAVDLIFELPDDSKDRRVRRVQPVDADVGPEVEIDVSAGPFRFVYAKRWLKQSETILHISEPSPEQLTGRRAHERAAAIQSDYTDRALWKALHMDQGVSLQQADYSGSRTLMQSLDRAASAQLAGEAADDLYRRVSTERTLYYTGTGRPGKELREVATRHEGARSRVRELEAGLGALEESVTEHDRLTRELDALAAERASEAAAVERLARELEALAGLRAEIERLTAAERLAANERSLADAALEQRRALVDAVAGRREEKDRLDGRLVACDAAARESLVARDASAAALEAANQALAAAEARAAQAASDFTRCRDLLDRDLLRERERTVAEALATCADADAFLAACRIDDAALREIENAHVEVERARALVDAGQTSVAVESLREQIVAIDGRPVALGSGETARIAATERLEIDLSGVARIAVEPGSSTRELAASLARARETLAGALERAGAKDVAAARELARRRSATESAKDAAERAVRDGLRDLTPDGIRERIDDLTARIAAHDEARAPGPMPDDLDAARTEDEAARSVVATARAAAAGLAAQLEAASQAHGEALHGASEARALAEQAARELDDVLARLDRERERVTDEVLVTARDDAAERARSAESARATAAAELERLRAGEIEGELERAREALARVEARAREATSTRDLLRGRLEAEGERGLHDALERARAEEDRAAGERERLERRAAAAELLFDVFTRHREEARGRYRAPLRDAIERLGRIVFGETFKVELDGDLHVSRRTLGGVTVPYDELSTGAREQLGVIERLACAGLVAPEGGAPVFLDDALGYSDPNRLAALWRVLEIAARDGQVVLLTSSPERYREIEDATRVELELQRRPARDGLAT